MIAAASCTNCRNVGRSHSTASGLPIVLFECRHESIRGLIRCGSCSKWNLMELYGTDVQAETVRLRCPEDGCRHLQTIPKDDDSRVRFLGFCAQENAESVVVPPPNWCPGMLPVQSPADAVEKPKRTTKKQRREAEQPSLF